MVNTEELPEAADFVRWLAERGELRNHFDAATPEERRRLWAGASQLVWPLVFNQVTRRVARKRGHFMCAMSVQRLAPDCLDRFHDDVEAVLADLFANAAEPIKNLEGWVTARLRRSTVDAHRRRRGERGAAQRPRVPAWLRKALWEDTPATHPYPELRAAWLVELAKSMLDWAGVEATAGAELWPVTAWTERRVTVTGDHSAGEAVVAAEIETVVAAMKLRPRWYDKNIEIPLGRKPAPPWLPRSAAGALAEPEPLVLVERHEADDVLLTELAAAALAVLYRRVERGEPLEEVAFEVLNTVFGELPASHDMDRAPGAGDETDQVLALINDPARLDRIKATIVELLS